MKSSVKGLIGLLLLTIVGTGAYYLWRQEKLQKIEKHQKLYTKSWNELDWKNLIVLGLWSDKALKIIESSSTYFLTLSPQKNISEIKIEKYRYSGKEIKEILLSKNSSPQKDFFLKSFFYLGDRAMIKSFIKEKENSLVLQINSLLENNLWWFHEKDPKGKILFFLDNEIIGVFQPKGPLIGDQLKLEKIHKSTFLKMKL